MIWQDTHISEALAHATQQKSKTYALGRDGLRDKPGQKETHRKYIFEAFLELIILCDTLQ